MAVQAVALQAKGLNSQFISTGKAINQEFAQRGAQAFDQFAEAVAGGASVFKSAKEAFLSFAADFLKKIALMIIEQLIFNAISGGSSGSGGIGGFVSSLVGGATKKHSGGLVGPGGLSVPAAWFANAQRYHSGGVVGLKPGEVPAILKRNEEVLTEDDPRHMFNRGAGGGREVAVRIENRIDPGDMVEAGLNTRVGEKAILNFIRANPGAVNSALGRR